MEKPKPPPGKLPSLISPLAGPAACFCKASRISSQLAQDVDVLLCCLRMWTWCVLRCGLCGLPHGLVEGREPWAILPSWPPGGERSHATRPANGGLVRYSHAYLPVRGACSTGPGAFNYELCPRMCRRPALGRHKNTSLFSQIILVTFNHFIYSKIFGTSCSPKHDFPFYPHKNIIEIF